ncbi:metallophosphoesterase [Bacillus thermotolerans]|nr:metallophosphoesterase [Bacillus thermotolerans]KKB34485.1 phosphoesterase [Bacillus thermotolerans]
MIWFLLTFLLVIVMSVFLRKAHKNTQKVALNKVDLTAGSFHHPAGPLLNVLHLSDMHIEKLSIAPEQLYKKLADEKIDLIALTGDYLDKRRNIPKLISYLKVLNRLDVPYGMYAVFGNRDYSLKRKHFHTLKEVLEKYGCQTLQNQHVTIHVRGRQVNIIGVDDFHTERSNLKAAFANLKAGYRLVLTHDPNVVLHMEKYEFDYLLSGHFHGGQICWPKPYHLAALGRQMLKMNMIKGLHYYKKRPFYISEGLGQTSVNIRVGSRPEMALHQLSLNKRTKEKTQTAM